MNLAVDEKSASIVKSECDLYLKNRELSAIEDPLSSHATIAKRDSSKN